MAKTPRPKFESVGQYLKALPAPQRRKVKKIISQAQDLYPEAELTLSYGVPAFRDGKVYFYVAGFKNHISLFPPLRTNPALRKKLRPYQNAKGNLLFPMEEEIPSALIAELITSLHRQICE